MTVSEFQVTTSPTGGQLIAPAPGDNQIYNITIRQLSHGYIVEVGCKTFAIETDTKLVSLLSQYILQPNNTQQQYNDGTLFKPKEA